MGMSSTEEASGHKATPLPAMEGTTMSATTTTSAATAAIAGGWIRGTLNFLATMELGWAHTQLATNVDQYTKGKGASMEVITLSFSADRLAGYSHSKGGKPVTITTQKQGSKIQRAQGSLGKEMPLTGPGSKWNLSSKGKAEMQAWADQVFKVISK